MHHLYGQLDGPRQVPPEIYEHACCFYNFEENQADCVETWMEGLYEQLAWGVHEDFFARQRTTAIPGPAALTLMI